jgi:hypothetical protein
MAMIRQNAPRGIQPLRLISAAVIAVMVTVMPLAAFAQDLPAASDVKAPPRDATKTPSGLAYKVVKPGTGKAHPTATSSVTVNYTGGRRTGRCSIVP